MVASGVTVVGGGLAGTEAAWQLAQRGLQVKLYEMKPLRFSPAHESENLAELVCSNSLRGDALSVACGLLKEELRRLGSLLITCADKCAVKAGRALAVDRNQFSKRLSIGSAFSGSSGKLRLGSLLAECCSTTANYEINFFTKRRITFQ